MHRDYGEVSVHRLGPLDYHLVAHPDGVKRVLQDNHPNYTKRVADVQAVGYLTGPGVLVADGADWMRRRRLMQPAFHRERIAAMSRTMERLTAEWLEEWRQAPPGTVHNATEAITRLTVRIAAMTLFSLDLNEQAKAVMNAFTAANELLIRRFRKGRFFPPVFIFDEDREFLHHKRRMNAVIDEIISQRRQENAAQQEQRQDLLAMLMSARDEQDGGFLSDEELRAEVQTLLLAGFETTSNALNWAIYELGRQPDWGARIAEEAAMPLLERVAARAFFEETMRVYPPAWYTARRAEKADEILGFAIPRGARIVVSPYLLHRHPQFWQDPARFDAGRFLPGMREGAHRFSFFPFGAGPRQCIGNQFAMAEGLTILTAFASAFAVELADRGKPTPLPLITLRMREELRIRVHPR